MDLLTKAARYVAGTDRNPSSLNATATVDLILNRLRNGRLPSERLHCVETLTRRLDDVDRSVARAFQARGNVTYEAIMNDFRHVLTQRREIASKGCVLFSAVLEQDRTEVEIVQSTLVLLLLLLSPETITAIGNLEHKLAGSTENAVSGQEPEGVTQARMNARQSQSARNLLGSDDWRTEINACMINVANTLISGESIGSSQEQQRRLCLVPILLDLLAEGEFSIRLYVSDILTHIAKYSRENLQRVILECPRGIARIVDLLRDPREVIRNNALRLLMELSRGNTEIQKILVFENIFERLLEIVDAARYEEVVGLHESQSQDQDRSAQASEQDTFAYRTSLSSDSSKDDDEDSIINRQMGALAQQAAFPEDKSYRADASRVGHGNLGSAANPADYLTRDCLTFIGVLLEGDPANATLFAEAGCIPKLSSFLFLNDTQAKTMNHIEAENLIQTIHIVDHLMHTKIENIASQMRSLCLHFGVTESLARLIHVARGHASIVTHGLHTLGRLASADPPTLAFLHELWVPVSPANDSRAVEPERDGVSKSAAVLFVTFIYDLLSESDSTEVRAAAFCFLDGIWLTSDIGLRWMSRLVLGTAPQRDDSSSHEKSFEGAAGASENFVPSGQVAEALDHLGHEILLAAVGWPDTADAVAVFYTCSLLASWMIRCRKNGLCDAPLELLRVHIRGPIVSLAPRIMDSNPSFGESFFIRLTRTLGRAVREMSPPLVRTALLILMCCWLHDSEKVQQQLLSASLSVPLLMDIISAPGRRADSILSEQIRGLATLALAECMESTHSNDTSERLSPHVLLDIVQKRIGMTRFASFLDDVRASTFFASAISYSPSLLLDTRSTEGLSVLASKTGSNVLQDLGHASLYPSDLVYVMEPIYEKVQRRLIAQYIEPERDPRLLPESEQASGDIPTASIGRSFATGDAFSADRRQGLKTQLADPLSMEQQASIQPMGAGDFKSLNMRIRELEDMVGQIDEYKRVIREQDVALNATKEEMRLLNMSLKQSQEYADAQMRSAEERFAEELGGLRQALSEREDLIFRLREQIEHLERTLESRQHDLESISRACEALESENERLRTGNTTSDDTPLHGRDAGSVPANEIRDSVDEEQSGISLLQIGDDRSTRSLPTRFDEIDELQMQLAEERKNVARLTVLLNQFENAERDADAELQMERLEKARLVQRVAQLEQLVRIGDGAEVGTQSIPSNELEYNAPTGTALGDLNGPLWSEASTAGVDAELAWNARINVPDHRDNVAFDEREKYIARLEAELSGLKQALSQTEEDAYETQSALEAQIVRLEDERGALRDELAELRTRNERDLRVYAEREDGTTDNLWGPDDDGLNQRWSMPQKESARNAEGSIGNANAEVLVGDSTEAAVGKQMSPYINIHPDLSKDKSCSSVSAAKRVDEIGLRKLQGSDQNLKSPEVKMMMLALAPLKSVGDRLREKESLVSSSLETMRKRLYAISSHVRRCQLAVKSPDSPLVFASTTERIAKTNEAPLQTASMEHFSEYHENKASVLVILEESIERILDGNRKLAELMESTSCANEQDSRVIEHIRIQGSEIDVLRARVNQLLSTKSDYDQIRGELPTPIVHSEGLEKELAARGADQARMQELETQYQLVCQERDTLAEHVESLQSELRLVSDYKNAVAILESQCATLRDEVMSKEENILALKQEHDQLCESHKHCLAQGDEIERLRDDLNRSRARIHECEADLELATTDRARYAELERSHVALRQRCEELERGSQELEILLESARCDSRNQTSLQTQIADLLEKDRQRETEIERLRSELIMLQDALSSREDELQHHENQLHNLQQALKSEREEALNTEKEFEQLNQELQEQLDSLRDDYERLQMEYNDTMNVKQSLACTLSEKQEQEQSLRSQVAALEAQNLETRAAMANEDATVMRAIIEQVHSGIQYLHSMSHTHAELIKKQQDALMFQEALLEECCEECGSLKDGMLVALESVIMHQNTFRDSRVVKDEAEYELGIQKMLAEQDRALQDLRYEGESRLAEVEEAVRGLEGRLVTNHSNDMQELTHRYERQIAELQSNHDANLRELMNVHEQVLQELEHEIEQLRSSTLLPLERSLPSKKEPSMSLETGTFRRDWPENLEQDNADEFSKNPDALERSLIEERIRTGDLRQENIRLQTYVSSLQTRLDAIERAHETRSEGLSDEVNRKAAFVSLSQDVADAPHHASPVTDAQREKPEQQSSSAAQMLAESRREVAEQRVLIAQLEQQIQELIERESRLASAIEMYHDENTTLRQRLTEKDCDDDFRPQDPGNAGRSTFPDDSSGTDHVRPVQGRVPDNTEGAVISLANHQGEIQANGLESELWRLREEHNELLICLAEMEMECNAYKERLQEFLLPKNG